MVINALRVFLSIFTLSRIGCDGDGVFAVTAVADDDRHGKLLCNHGWAKPKNISTPDYHAKCVCQLYINRKEKTKFILCAYISRYERQSNVLYVYVCVWMSIDSEHWKESMKKKKKKKEDSNDCKVFSLFAISTSTI